MKIFPCTIRLVVISIIFCTDVIAQSDSFKIDSLKRVLKAQKQDTNKIKTLLELSEQFLSKNDSSYGIKYIKEALSLSGKLTYKSGEAAAYNVLSKFYYYNGKKSESIEMALKTLKIEEELFNKNDLAKAYNTLFILYNNQGSYASAIEYAYKGLHIYEELKDTSAMAALLDGIGNLFESQQNLPEALKHYYTALALSEKTGDTTSIGEEYFSIARIYYMQHFYAKALKMDSAALNYLGTRDKWTAAWTQAAIARIYEDQGSYDTALTAYFTAINLFQKIENSPETDSGPAINRMYIGLGSVYTALGNPRRAEDYLNQALSGAIKINNKELIKRAYEKIAALDSARGNYREAYEHYKKFILYKDSLFNQENVAKIATHQQQYEYDKKSAAVKEAQDKKDAEARRRRNVQYFAIAIFLLLTAFLYWNSRQKQKAKTKIEKAYAELKSTQAQLIQSEKMASLGELTAGIAHEIQNPLNFVNNFSEVNEELIVELVNEADSGSIEEVKSIAKDIKQNLEKINHHGRRADAIVKGMLLHSRQSKGVKEPTDINALCDEYLRLSYHGMRAKGQKDTAHEAFNAAFTTDFDESTGKISIVPQDIGRVLLNLFNNAFYAVKEKQKAQSTGYRGAVQVQTKRLDQKVEIKISDNGNGIAQNIIDKIFQPFFTTKPTGQGTGLGLSLAYDIITKEHKGTIKVESKEGEGSVFILQLPLS